MRLCALLLALATTTAHAAGTVTRTPYVQNVGQTEATIMWRTSIQMAQTLHYGEGGTLDRWLTEDRATTTHEVRLTGLRPGTTYDYRLAGVTSPAAPTSNFRTDPGRGGKFFSFFVTADIGESAPDQANQRQTAAMILQQTPLPALGLLAGDIVYPDGDSDDYNAHLMIPWRDVFSRVCVWPALGNHDWMKDPERNFVREWSLPNNEHYYSFDYGNAHFIALDSQNGNLYDKANQIAWLEQDLARANGAIWTFVFMHHPMITCTYKGHEPELAIALMPLFERYGVDVVFTGHAHTYERLYPFRGGLPVDMDMDPHYVDPSGVIYIVSGAGGSVKHSAPTAHCGANVFFLDERILFTQVHVLDNAVVILAIDSMTGEVLDAMSILKHPTTSDVAVSPPRPRLLQNVPNPFNPATTLVFDIPVESLVRLDVYRADGRWITSLERGVRAPGTHRVLWDGRDHRGIMLPTGVYVAKLRAGPLRTSVKMTLLR